MAAGGKPKATLCVGGGVFIAGAAIQWLRDGLSLITATSEVEALASSVPDGGGVVLCQHFAGEWARHWDAYARGTILGITHWNHQRRIWRPLSWRCFAVLLDLALAMSRMRRYRWVTFGSMAEPVSMAC